MLWGRPSRANQRKGGSAMTTRGYWIVAVAGGVLLWGGLALAKGWTCDQRQSGEASKLMHKQDDCVEKLTGFGCTHRLRFNAPASDRRQRREGPP